MKKIIIKTNKTGITDEKILAKKPPFSKVLQNFHTVPKPFYKASWFSGGVAGVTIATVALVGYYFIKNGNNSLTSNSKNDSLAAKPFIAKPFRNMDVPYETISISSNCSHQLITKTGTILRIPDNAFVDSLGKPASFPVELKYREFRNPVDFFESGIPMNYDSNGVHYTFESAGMIELLANKDGKNLSLAKDKTIGVDMKSPTDNSNYNIYYLDTAKRNWVYKGKDLITSLNEKQKTATQNGRNINSDASSSNATTNKNEPLRDEIINTEDLNTATSKVPVVPAKANKGKYIFKLSVDLSDYPELNVYKNVMFQVDETSKKFDAKLYSVKWEKAKLNQSEKQGTYSLMLSKNDTTVSIAVIPVFDEKSYATAISVYNQNISKLIVEKQERDKQNNLKIQTALSSKNALQQTNDLVNTVLSSEMTSLRTFELSSFGDWNCERPMPPINRNFTISPRFINSADGKSIKYENVYIVDKNKNALFTYNKSCPLLCNKKSKNVLWIVTPDNKIGIVNSQVFLDAISESTTPVFNLTLLDNSEGVNELKSIVTGKTEETDNLITPETTTETTSSTLNVTAYPNPTKDVVNIKLQQQEKVTYSVVDLSGKLILKGQFNDVQYKIDLSNCVSGVYNLSLFISDLKQTKNIKIVKE